MKLGIVGLPNVGKSTLFNSLTKAGAESANYPFCTIDPNVGIVPVPDKRLQQLGDFYQSKKVTPAVIEFVDIAGLVKGASKGEGLGNQFLANIREVDAIVHVVRCFEDPNVIHVDGSIDPLRDIETIDLELIFADLEVLERRISKTAKSARMDKEAAKELEFQERLKKLLEDGKDAILMELQNEDEEKWIAEYNLLTSKPVIYAANVAEDDLADDGANNSYVQSVREYAKEHNSEVFVICAEIEAEISELEEDEKKMFLEDLGLTESGLEKLIAASYRLLGLMSFLTAGEDETRAWTIKVGTKAPQAAGKIHTDFERGFIKAEVVNYQDLLDCGSYAGAREKGLVRMEGKDYIVTAAAYDGYGYANRDALRNMLILLFIGGLTVLAIVGYILSRSTLKPIRNIVKEAEKITASHIDKRLPVKNEQDELGELSITFNDLLERLEKSFNSQKMFVSNVSHELRTPMAALTAELDLALLKERTSEQYQAAIGNALQDSRRIINLIDGLLNLAKADYQSEQITMEEVRLDELLLDARELVLKAHPDYHIELVFEQEAEEDNVLTVIGNSYLLTTAFVNLVENNCKYSSNRTSSVLIAYWEQWAIIRLSDNGVGMSDVDKENLFKLFYRGENKNIAPGNGIGMTLTQKIIHLHKGELTVSSHKDEGTTFVVKLPHI